jgi:hypothetical protein
MGEWLDGELGGVPPELAARIRRSLATGWESLSLASAPRALCDAATAELRALLEQGCESRTAAAPLLTVDALVTLACQALAASAADIEHGTDEMLTALSATLPTPDDAA